MFDKLLENEFKKFGIDSDLIENDRKLKYLNNDEKWEILEKFFRENSKKTNIVVNQKERSFTMVFPTSKDAFEFARSPSIGLASNARKYVSDRGENPTDYDIFFNISIVYDESSKNKKPNVVIVRLV